MLYVLWSAKGGAGTTVTTAMLASAMSSPPGVLLVDLAGDLPRAVGVPEPPIGVAELLAALASAGGTLEPERSGAVAGGGEATDRPDGADQLRHAEVEVVAGISVIGRGGAPALDLDGADRLLDLLAADPRAVVVDAGTLGRPGSSPTAEAVADRFVRRADSRLLVTRPCYLGLRAASTALTRVAADGCILLTEEGRALTAPDVAAVLGLPVVAEVPVVPRVARSVDAGLLLQRRDAASVQALSGAT